MPTVTCDCKAKVVAINNDFERAIHTITLDLTIVEGTLLASSYRLNLIYNTIDELGSKFRQIAKASGDNTYSYQKACSIWIPAKLTVAHNFDSDIFNKLTFSNRLTLGINGEHGYFLVD